MANEEEYRAARGGVAQLELATRGLLEVSGPQRQRFLQGMLSHELQERKPGEGCRAALLDVKGHVLAILRALVRESSVRLELPADRIALLEQTLQRYRVAAPVRFQAGAERVVAVLGPGTDELLRGMGAELPGDVPEAHIPTSIAERPALLSRASDLPGRAVVLHVAPADLDAVCQALAAAGALRIATTTLDVLRVEAGRPLYGQDVTQENLLHETGLVSELCSFQKGCYIGQEVIARLEARGGNVNKHLRGLRLSSPAAPGAAVSAAAREVGRVTTAGVSPELGPIAMAYVHRSHSEAGSLVDVAGAAATVATLPLLRVEADEARSPGR